MKTRTITTYTAEELRDQFPDAYQRAYESLANDMSQEIPWMDETMDSLKAVVKACGGELNDWSIGPESYRSYVRVSASDTYEGQIIDDDGNQDYEERTIDAPWFTSHILAPIGYVDAEGKAAFPGHCKLTGYCADDDFIEAVYRSLDAGETLTDALRGLADVASRLIRAELEQAVSEESFDAQDFEFDENGHTLADIG